MNGAESPHPMFTFAHLSDPHLAIQSAPGLRSLMNKRLIGYLSWRTKRRAIHETRVLAALTGAIKQARTDHIAITGDLTNIALPAEFKEARRWLEEFGPPGSITLVPGNHDAYVGVPWSASLGLWTDYMRGDSEPMDSTADFPTVRVRGPVAFVGVSSAHPSAPHLAIGSVGAKQLAALEQKLAELGRKKLFRIILIHHPPVPGTVKPRASLRDSAEFARVVASAGAELVLHGHTHRMSHHAIATSRGDVPVIGVASASAKAQHAHREQAQFHVYTVANEADRWRLDLEIRGLDEEALAFRTTRTLSVPVPA
jgi:3',5'-cyclic AMP phosphodiesterase CpdA